MSKARYEIFHDMLKLIKQAHSKARSHFNDTNEPVALTAFGITFYIITQAKHSAEVYRNTETLSFEEFVQGLMRTNGSNEKVIQVMYSSLPVDKPGFPNPLGESLGVLAQKMHIHQLNPGNNLMLLQKQGLIYIDHLLRLGTMQSVCKYATSRSATHIEVPLYKWCGDSFVRLGQHVYVGEALDEIDPLLPKAFLDFDERSWKMLYQYPDFLSRDMSTPRTRVVSSLTRYFQIPKYLRSDGAAWLINAMEEEMRALVVDDENLAILMLHLYFVINTSTRKSAFWVLTYLLHNPTLLKAYREETEAAFRHGELIDPSYIQDPIKCPQVDRIWHETLRLASWSASIRRITQDTTIGGKVMLTGNRVLVPHRLLHFDATIFGENPQSFIPERWLKENLGRSTSWRPFGAGKTTCSGRFLARFEVTTFVVILLRRFDVEMVGSPQFPVADVGRPVLGIMSIRKGHDFRVRLSERRY
ncbi:hypothetical protein HYALB_00006408 [Hymenoscyphus albidus]|uniref:Cytochrome P450 n=1 Tax=Hymenoscyphus albidus TaxID=595503 RepID=A0A9N9LGA8_9HELO|nr:hypothetical protein HYALB_00006408 [Hymenoscyphus albidus]